jgi:hypothetical protein
MNEPDWIKNIPSETVCNFFYFFFVLYAVLAVLALITAIGGFVYGKKLGPAGMLLGFQGLLITLIPAVFALFYYIICNRALLSDKRQGVEKRME